ncbi:MAG: glycosyltransferase family 2 protein [Candidatus Omnitrophica bacterium]|nr:glycosyltransferase family 2 protein [Candidatus Omnitrophota bacterium]
MKGEWEPTVSVVLSIWNEEDVIERKVKNLLSLEYPAEKIEFLIGSDGSSDQTNEIIRQISDPRVHFIESVKRRGKMATLNELAKAAKHEVIVFTDARQTFKKDAVRVLVRNFNDPKIGCVSGELMLAEKEGATAKGISLYWNYEKFIRKAESRIHSMLGATGAIYAIRRELFLAIPEHIVLDDMFVPFKIIQKGYRAVFDSCAIAYDEVADSPKEEYRRKARTLYGNYQIFWSFRDMFNPFKSPIAVQLFSHKFLRVLIPFFMIALFFMNWHLSSRLLYGLFFDLQKIFYLMAVIGGLARNQKYGILKGISKACYIPYVFCLLNFSAFVGFIRFIIIGQEIRWEKAREKEA